MATTRSQLVATLSPSALVHKLPGSKAITDNLCIRFASTLKLADVEPLIASRIHEKILPAPSEEATGKFGVVSLVVNHRSTEASSVGAKKSFEYVQFLDLVR